MTVTEGKTPSFYKIVRNASVIGILVISFSMGALFGAYYNLSRDLPSVARLELRDYTTGLITKVYSSDGQVIHEFFEQKRIPIKLSQVPRDLVEATLAVEDQSFYSHWGVDFAGGTRLGDMAEGRVVKPVLKP